MDAVLVDGEDLHPPALGRVLLDHGDDARSTYRLLRSVRQYGDERLTEVGEADLVRDRHAQWVAAAVERWLKTRPPR